MIPPSPHRSRRPLAATLAAVLLLSAAGCARTGSFLALNPRRASLRDQLSRLEFQNQQLKDEVEVAREESQRLSSDLQLAEIDRQDLERRLDRYQTQLGQNLPGDAPADSYELARPDPGESSPDFRATLPAAQPPGRAPFTAVPNRSAIDVTPPPGPPADDSFGTRRPSYEETPKPYIDPPPVQYFDLSPSAGRANVGLSARGASSSWSPLARGSADRDRDYR